MFCDKRERRTRTKCRAPKNSLSVKKRRNSSPSWKTRRGLIRSILLGISLQYKALEQQKQLLLGQAQNPQNADAACLDPKNIQIAASLIVLYALFWIPAAGGGHRPPNGSNRGLPRLDGTKAQCHSDSCGAFALCRLISPENSPAAESAASAERQAETL